MNYSQFYENRITKELDKKEVSLWNDFYNNILPERVEQFKKVYRGKPQKLQKAIEKLEQEYREEIDEQLTTLCDGLRTQAYFDALRQLDSLSEGVPDKADHSQPLASEIISEVNAKLRAAEADRDTFYEQKSVYQMQLDIINFAMHITDPIMLKEIYADTKVAYEKQTQEDEEWTTERK